MKIRVTRTATRTKPRSVGSGRDFNETSFAGAMP